MQRLVLCSTVVLLTLAACAPSTGPMAGGSARSDQNQCFRPDLVRNFTAPSDQTLYVRTVDADVFRIDTVGCRDLQGSLSIALEPLVGTSRLCVGDPAGLIARSPCRVRVGKKLTAEEIAALPSRDRP